MQNHKDKQAWLAVDLGGTHLRFLAVDWDPIQSAMPDILQRLALPSPKGLAGLIAQLRQGRETISAQLLARGWRLHPALAMGSPGRFYQDRQGTFRIAARTAAHLEATPGEFDDVDLQGALAEGLGLGREQIFLDNDAVVQGLYLIDQILRGSLGQALQGERVVCINPGTGLGGCVAAVDAQGQVQTFTDGHISELMLGSWDADPKNQWHFSQQVQGLDLSVSSQESASAEARDNALPSLRLALKERNGQVQHVTFSHLQGKQAEDCLSGSGLARFAVAVDAMCQTSLGFAPLAEAQKTLSQPAVDGALLSALIVLPGPEASEAMTFAVALARWIADFAGAALSRLVDLLVTANLHKGPGFPDWDFADVQRLKGVRRFVLGGGMAYTPLGQWLLASAQQLQQGTPERYFLHPTLLMQDPGTARSGAETADAGALGALFLLKNRFNKHA